MKCLQRIGVLFLIAVMVICMTVPASAHSGRTDSSGGHKDNKNQSGLGSYHYHCGGYPAHLHSGGYCPYTDVFPSSVYISLPKTTLRINEKVAISATVYPENSVRTDYTLASDNTDVIKIVGDQIQAVGYGYATITATAFNGVVGYAYVYVNQVMPWGITITTDESGSNAYIGTEKLMSATLSPEDVDDPTVTWSSSDESIATVTNGRVTPIAPGSATIYATTANGIIGSYWLYVQEVATASVDITQNEKLSIGYGTAHALQATIYPENASYKELTWTSSDPSVISVNSLGILNAVGFGTATITATSTNGMSDSVEVECVEIKPAFLQLKAPTQIHVGDNFEVSTLVYPQDTTFQECELSLSNGKIAKFVDDGVVQALNPGELTIRAILSDIVETIDVVILPIDVEEISLTPSDKAEVQAGETLQFRAEILPNNATDKTIRWVSTDEDVGTIDENGLFTAVGSGSTVIIAYGDGNKCLATTSVSVPEKGSGAITAVVAAGASCAATLAATRASRKRRE